MKRIFSALLALVLAFSLLPAAAFAAGADIPDSGDLFYGYLLQQARKQMDAENAAVAHAGGPFTVRASSVQAAKGTVGQNLTGMDKALYDYMAVKIAEVADGSLKSTSFSIPCEDLGANMTITSADLGGKSLGTRSGGLSAAAEAEIKNRTGANVNDRKVVNALLADYPYETYWFDKTKGYIPWPGSYAATRKTYASDAADAEITQIEIFNYSKVCMTFTMYVIADYSAAGKSGTTDMGDVNTAAIIDNAAALANSVAGKSDYEKLVAFKDYILEAVSYDHGSVGVNNHAHQLLNVFDGDSSTNVVCEGYAKAFKLLCDLAGVECYDVTGKLNSGHMWNIVVLDGKNYLVDLTNCDSGAKGYPDKLFLKGVKDPTASGFIASTGTSYTYDDDTKSVFSASLLTLSTTDYPVSYKVTLVSNFPDCVTADKVYASAGDTVTLTFAPPQGYRPKPVSTSPTVEVNNGSFTMPGSDVTVQADFERVYTVSVAPDIQHGTASVYPVYAAANDTVTVTFVPDPGYQLGSVTTAPNVTIEGGRFSMPASDMTVSATFEPAPLSGTVTITGTPKAGETLSANVTGSNNTGELFYRWFADGFPITEAGRENTYTLTSNEEGKPIACVVTSSVQTGSIQSARTARVAPADTPAPVSYRITLAPVTNGAAAVQDTAVPGEAVAVTATPADGYELNAITVTPSTSVANGTFIMPSSDVTVTVTFKVKTAPQPVQLTGAVTVSGTPKVGETLTAIVSMNNTGALSYQWMADGANIIGANGTSYTLTAAEQGKAITLAVTSAAPAGIITSQPTAQVAAADSTPVPVPAPQQTSLWLDRSRMDLYCGDFGRLIASVSPSAPVVWTSSNTAVVTVDSAGNWYACNPGVAYLTATANGTSASCYVTVSEYVSQNRSSAYTPPVQTTNTNQTVTAASTEAPQTVTRTVDNHDGTKSTFTTGPDNTTSVVRTDNLGRVISESVTYSGAAYASTSGVLTLPAAVTPSSTLSDAPVLQLTIPFTARTTVKVPLTRSTSGTVAVIESMFGPNGVVKNSRVEGDCLVFAVDGSSIIKVVDNSRSFSDVTAYNWFAGAVDWASSHGVMNGVGENRFDPYGTMSRAQMTQLLYNYANASADGVSSAFSDVNAWNWYAGSVAWAVSNGIAYPSGVGSFGAGDALTREDMATMLFNYTRMMGYNAYTEAGLSAFADGAEVSDWARAAMSWAVGSGLITGVSDGSTVALDPKGTATRAQLAVVMQRYSAMFPG